MRYFFNDILVQMPDATHAPTPTPPLFSPAALSSPRRRGSCDATPRPLKPPLQGTVVWNRVPAFTDDRDFGKSGAVHASAGMTALPGEKNGCRSMGVGVRLCIDCVFSLHVICHDVRFQNCGDSALKERINRKERRKRIYEQARHRNGNQ